VVIQEHRIAAGVLVESDGKVLLQPPFRVGSRGFWGTPVGGALGDMDPRAIASARIGPKRSRHSSPIAHANTISPPAAGRI
jgi:hypothetical protein